MSSFYVNGMPLRGVYRPFGFTVTPQLKAAVSGIRSPLHPDLSQRIDAFTRANPPPKKQGGWHASSFWVGTSRHRNRWPTLDRVALDLLQGKPRALEPFEKILDGGFIAEMRIALELMAGRGDVENRNRALIRLRSLEREFADWHRSPKTVSFEEQRDFVQPFINAAVESYDFDVAHYRGHGIPVLNLFFDLAQLHTFIRERSSLLHPFEGGMKPSTLTDLLIGELGNSPLSGACHPLSIMAAHLGGKIGLSLKSYFSEEHVALFVNLGPGFIYDPTEPLLCFLPPDIFVKELRSPNKERPYDLSLLLLEMGLHETFYDSDAGRQSDALMFLIEHVAPKLWLLWYRLGYTLAREEKFAEARLALEKGLAIFENSLPLLIQYTDLLLYLGEESAAQRVFEKANRILRRRLILGESAHPSDPDMAIHTKLSARFGGSLA